MTNAEKFEEVFGHKLNPNYFKKWSCAIFNTNPCKKYDFDCNKCPLFYFWDKEYKAESEEQTDETDN